MRVRMCAACVRFLRASMTYAQSLVAYSFLPIVCQCELLKRSSIKICLCYVKSQYAVEPPRFKVPATMTHITHKPRAQSSCLFRVSVCGLWKGNNPQWLTNHAAMQTTRAQWCNATWPRKPWPTMAHRPKGKNCRGEGVGPTAKGQQKRSVHEQFFFLQNFYFLL